MSFNLHVQQLILTCMSSPSSVQILTQKKTQILYLEKNPTHHLNKLDIQVNFNMQPNNTHNENKIILLI